MTNKEYKIRLDEHDEGKYYLEHYTNKTFGVYDCGIRYNATTENLKDFRNMRKADNGIKLTDRAYIRQNERSYTLVSYYTDVLEFVPETGAFLKLWKGYSVTTMKHINLFLNYFGHKSINKRDWIQMLTYAEILYPEAR